MIILFGTTTTFAFPYAKQATAATLVYAGNTPYDYSAGTVNEGFSNFQFILISVIVGEAAAWAEAAGYRGT